MQVRHKASAAVGALAVVLFTSTLPAQLPAPPAPAVAVQRTGGWFPSGTLFTPLAADLKEPRHYASFRRTMLRDLSEPPLADDGTMTAALVALGTEIGIWGWRRGPRTGMQASVVAGVFTQFDVSERSPPMLNADYLVGAQLTWRRGDLGVRSRLLHQSSHLGDGLLRRARELDVPLDYRGGSMEWMDAMLFVDGAHLRVYGTARYVINSVTSFAPWQTGGGVELQARRTRSPGVQLQPFAALHVEALEERAWGTTRSAMAGVGIYHAGASRGLRISAVYQNGFTPFGRYMTSVRVRSYGVQLDFTP